MDFQQLVSENRERLKRLANLRLGAVLQRRVDSSDVVQEACIDALKQFDHYRNDPQVSPYVWLRFFICQKIVQLHRTHVKAQARDVRREISIDKRIGPVAESSVLAINLVESGDSPSRIVEKRERTGQLVEALDALDPLDREVIALRNFEHLTADETAELTGLSTDAVYKRHTRALLRLKNLIKSGNHDG